MRGVPRRNLVGEHSGRQCAGNRRLLGHLDIADFGGERLQRAALTARLVEQRAQVVCGAFDAVILGEDRVAQRRLDAVRFEGRVVLEVNRLGVAALQPIERRLRDVEKTLVDQVRHLAEEERQQQRADVAAVDVGVGHDDDAVIARLRGVEILGADAGAEGRDQGADLGRAQHLVEAGALDIQDFALERQDRLKAPVAALLGGAAGAVALDDKQLALGRVALLAVGELAGKIGDVERALAPRQVARLARRLARGRRLDDLRDDLLGVGRVFLEPLRELVGDDALDHRPHFRGDELVLGLRGEFRVGHLDRENAGQALAHVLAGQRHLFLFGDAAVVGVGVDGAGQRGAEAGEMRPAVALRDVVGEAQHRLVIAVGPLHRDFEQDVVTLAADRDRRRMQHLLGAVEIVRKGFETAFEMQGDGFWLDPARVVQHQRDAAVQKGELAQPVLERA